MSLYNLMHGVNPLAGTLLSILNLTTGDVGRFRDSYLAETDDGGIEIHVYTRNGGGNREHWNDEQPEGESCDCPGCVIRFRIPKHQQYVRDFDDDFDCTYATVVYRIPERFVEPLKALAELVALLPRCDYYNGAPCTRVAMHEEHGGMSDEFNLRYWCDEHAEPYDTVDADWAPVLRRMKP